MNKEKLITELKNYLKQKNVNYYAESLNFKGLRENVPQPDDSVRSLYIVSFMASTSNNKYDSDIIFYAYFDEKSKKLLYIIGPQSFEKIE
ncbi:hypothetical protein OX283_009580 [Flavobacterium sp. SUN052]|uniref:hypothetical protein n=1 Tax=Flavobacterium sp. SUN052 TaxID=3002441 RepID=UPI00237E6586|nr:hypothetical protein [Flavobacterium sp. SUN052]MEC4004905.1 hypothetical protein [Flavobacterium sp. SUN052]